MKHDMKMIWHFVCIILGDLFCCISVSLVQAACAGGTCENVFKGFSDCLLRLGENMVNYPQELDDSENLQTICS